MLRSQRLCGTGAHGASLLEVIFALALTATVAGVSVPMISSTMDDVRTAMAARYVAARLGAARMEAVKRSSATALRFEAVGEDYRFTPISDGNGNGVRSAEIRAGIDRAIGPVERLRDTFPGVRFALLPDAPDADSAPATGVDGVRIGPTRILTLGCDGTATSGTLYVRGRRAQYAVRVLGVTGRIRVLQYQSGDRTWLNH